MSGAGWVLAAALGAAILGGCDGQARGVELQIITKASCGTSTTQWDLSCVQAVVTRVLDRDGAVISSQCTEVFSLFGSIDELINLSAPVRLLEDLTPAAGVRVEIEGYHRLVSQSSQPCEGLLPSERMFWGRSDSADLTDPSLARVQVYMECRPKCDCGELDVSCPLALETGICAGATVQPCRHVCEVAEDCYDGGAYDMGCIAEACASVDIGGMCWECAGPADCDSGTCGTCVSTSSPGCGAPDEHFCALPCPAGPDSAEPCPPTMGCKRLGAGEYELVVP